MKKWVKKRFRMGAWLHDGSLLPARTNTAWWHDWVMKGKSDLYAEVAFKGQKNGLWMPGYSGMGITMCITQSTNSLICIVSDWVLVAVDAGVRHENTCGL